MPWTVFDPTDLGFSVVLANFETTAKFIDGNLYQAESARGRPGYINGKWYLEFEFQPQWESMRFGVGTVNANIHEYLGIDIEGWAIDTEIVLWHNDLGQQAPLLTWDLDRFMMAVDIDAHKIWFGLKGAWGIGADPASGLSPDYDNLYGAIHIMASGMGFSPTNLIDKVTIYADPSSWLYSPPAGFSGMYISTTPILPGGSGIHSSLLDRGAGMFLGAWQIDDYLTFPANTHSPVNGAATDADAVPAYRVYEDETGTPLLTGTMAKLDDANTTGFYSARIQLTAAAGFEEGKSYTIYISAAVGAVTGTISHSFQIEAAAIDITVPPVKPWTAWPWPHA